MFLMDPLTKILTYVFLAGSMLGIGLKVGKDEVLSVIRDKGWLVRMFVANFVLIPAVGILAARFLAVKPENGLALIVLACAPGGMSALQYMSKGKESAVLAYGGGTTVLLSLLSIFLSPLLISLAIPKGMTLTVPYGTAILFVSLSMLLPLVLGFLIHRTAGAVARKLGGPVALIATLAFIGAMVKLLNLTKWAKGELGKRGLLFIVGFILISMLIGWLLGGPRKFTRPVLATVSSIRNIALALAIALRSFDDLAVLTPLVAFMAIMVPANLIFMLILKVAGKRKAKAVALTAALLLLMLSGTGALQAATAKEIDAKVDAALDRFQKEVKGSAEFLKSAKGVCVFAGVIKAGLGIGGEYGEGALRTGGQTVDYYSIASGSIGLQFGAQKKDVIIVFMEEQALKKFRDSSGWKAGVDGSVALIDIGAGKSIDSTNIKDPIVGFVVGQKGLMYNLTLEGSKISKLKKDK